jgi:ribosomal protein L7/L12
MPNPLDIDMLYPNLGSDAMKLIKEDDRASAVRLVQSVTMAGLKNSKDYVDALAETLNP